MKRCTQCGLLKDETESWRIRRGEVPGKENLRARCRACCSNDPKDHSDDPRPEGKICRACKEWKPLAEFHRHKICRYGVEAICKRCKFRKRKERDTLEPSRMRRMDLKAKYCMSLADYVAMRERQEGRCAICGTEEERLVVEHNHRTGKVRALLCHLCNAMIGCAREEPAILLAALAYLHAERHPETGAVRAEVRYVARAAVGAVEG